MASTDFWIRYVPSARAPWDLRRVVHLHHRAGFAATWPEIERDLADGPHASVERLLRGGARSPALDNVANVLAASAINVDDAPRLKAWWIYRMLYGGDPLGERLTLFWHNYFATSNHKVADLAAMKRQNEIFRNHGRGPFGELLRRVLHDPALLIWLDAPSNRREHPNENLARELMELFTLGVGHYTEADVHEAARTLTGWSVAGDGFREDRRAHDPCEKTILGRRGRLTGDDLIQILLDQPATAHRLAMRLLDHFMGEGGIHAATVDALARGLRQNNLDVGWAVATILHSQEFFSPANLGNRVRSPVEYVVGAVRALELIDPPPSTLVLADWTMRLGEDLFYPPNVFGWPGGRSWLTTQSIVGRANYAAALVKGMGIGRPESLDALGLARRHGHTEAEAPAFFCKLLLGGLPDESFHDCLTRNLDGDGPEQARRAAVLILGSPEGQLG